MELSEYLKQITTCTDIELASELVISDNYPLFLDIDFDQLLDYFHNSDKYYYKNIMQNAHQVDFIPGTILLQVMDWVVQYKLSEMGTNLTILGAEHARRQMDSYTSTIMLHPYQEKKIFDIHWYRATAIVIQDLCDFIIDQKIPACLPNLGDNHSDDLSRTVYYKP